MEHKLKQNFIFTALNRCPCLYREKYLEYLDTESKHISYFEHDKSWIMAGYLRLTLELSFEVFHDELPTWKHLMAGKNHLSEQRIIRHVGSSQCSPHSASWWCWDEQRCNVQSGIEWGTLKAFLLRVWSLHSCFSVSRACFRPTLSHVKLTRAPTEIELSLLPVLHCHS